MNLTTKLYCYVFIWWNSNEAKRQSGFFSDHRNIFETLFYDNSFSTKNRVFRDAIAWTKRSIIKEEHQNKTLTCVKHFLTFKVI